MKTKLPWILLGVGLITATPVPVLARVKLAALPERARTVLSLSHPEAALVEEERVLTLQKGVNQIDFSWKDVNIDSTSIQVRMLSHPAEVLLLNTSYPPNENALIWAVSSPQAQEEKVRISYLLQGVRREIVYKAVAEPDEKSLTWRNYLRLRNDSGEELTDAEISIGYGANFKKSIANGEILEMLSERVDAAPINKVLTWDSAQLPWDPEYEHTTVGIPLYYVLKNDTASKLGTHTLLPGKARLFVKTKETSTDGEAKTESGAAFIGEDWVTLTPIDRELKLNIGQSRDVKVVQRKIKDERVNLRRNNVNNIVMWDNDESYKIEIENFKNTEAHVKLIEHAPGYWQMTANSHPDQYKKKDAFTFEYDLTLPALSTGEKKTTVTFQLHRINVQNQEPSTY
jgi:hypothetical protein